MIEVDSLPQPQNSNIIAKSLPVKLRMDDHSIDTVFLMLIKLRSLECTSIIFTNSNFQSTKIKSLIICFCIVNGQYNFILGAFDVMCSCDHFGCSTSEIIV